MVQASLSNRRPLSASEARHYTVTMLARRRPLRSPEAVGKLQRASGTSHHPLIAAG